MASQPLVCRAFRPAASPRWLLCGATGSSSVFALPWGRASAHPEAEATFPTAVELLNVPSVPLEPMPQEGVLGMHSVVSAQCRAHLAEAFGIASERAYFSGQDAEAGCDLVLVLSDKALHVVLLCASRTAATEDDSYSFASGMPPQMTSPLPATALNSVASTGLADQAARPVHSPLISHLLPASKQLGVDVADAAEAAAGDAKSSTADSTSALHARIHELEKRALNAEQRLGELHTSFGLFAAESRQQTNALLSALDGLLAERKAGKEPPRGGPA